MQLEYVVEFEVESTDSDIDPYQNLLIHCLRWLHKMGPTDTTIESFYSDGSSTLSGRHKTKEASWTGLQIPDVGQAIVLTVRENVDLKNTVLDTRVSISSTDRKTDLRISIGRESLGEGLSPSESIDIFQPTIVKTIAFDSAIKLSVKGQTQGGDYLHIRSEEEVEALADILVNSNRLPVLIIHCRTLEARESAKMAARNLVGLTQVVTVDYRSMRLLSRLLPQIQLEFSSAILAWSDLSSTLHKFSDRIVNGAKPTKLADEVMALTAPASVAARGPDRAFRKIEMAGLRLGRNTLEETIPTPNLSLKNDQQELGRLRDHVRDLEELALEESGRADQAEIDITTYQDELKSVKAQNYRLQDQLNRHTSEPDDESAIWLNCQCLIQGNAESAEAVFAHLEDAAGGCIKFTDRAVRSWRNANFGRVEEMTKDLVSLSKASRQLYADKQNQGTRLVEWFRTDFGLTIALFDSKIEQDRKLRSFEYEKQKLDRVPHVKVTDATHFGDVGRIHFALDRKNQRIVVDHVGLKLYE